HHVRSPIDPSRSRPSLLTSLFPDAATLRRARCTSQSARNSSRSHVVIRTPELAATEPGWIFTTRRHCAARGSSPNTPAAAVEPLAPVMRSVLLRAAIQLGHERVAERVRRQRLRPGRPPRARPRSTRCQEEDQGYRESFHHCFTHVWNLV